MRWTKKLPVIDSVKRISKFAWTPVLLDTQEMVWLERFYIVERYVYKYTNIYGKLNVKDSELINKDWHEKNCNWEVMALVPYDNHTEVHMLTLKK